MPVRRSPGVEILLLLRWTVAAGELTPAAVTKLGPYITRYAETLNTRVHAVGGVADHLHLLADIPPDMPAERVSKELHAPTARYLRDVLNVRDFAWEVAGVSVVSVSPGERELVVAYLADQEARHASGDLIPAYESGGAATVVPASTGEELPGWLVDAMKRG